MKSEINGIFKGLDDSIRERQKEEKIDRIISLLEKISKDIATLVDIKTEDDGK